MVLALAEFMMQLMRGQSSIIAIGLLRAVRCSQVSSDRGGKAVLWGADSRL